MLIYTFLMSIDLITPSEAPLAIVKPLEDANEQQVFHSQ